MIKRMMGAAVLLLLFGTMRGACDGVEKAGDRRPAVTPAATAAEARARALLLHETIHGALQVMHRDFFDKDDLHVLPSQSLEDVFKELERSFAVQARWLIVNTKITNVDHQPRDEFERRAAAALAEGMREFESVENGFYRRVGAIRLHNECLKCHVSNRRSLEDRFAGLAISMPLKGK